MAKAKYAKTVEWLSEGLIGHVTAILDNGVWKVEVRCSGEVVIDGQEYILDQVVTLPVDKSHLGEQGGTR